MKFVNFAIAASMLVASGAWASGGRAPNLQKRTTKASYVLNEWHAASEAIPDSLFKASECVLVMPEVVKAGFVVGGRLGRGMVSCRAEQGAWSNPVYMQISGASFGLLIGIESSDLVLVFTRENAPSRLSVNNVTLGAHMGVAVGPLGRDLQAGTDWKLQSEVYSFARTRGLYAGLSLEGAVLSLDSKANYAAYGDDFDAKATLTTAADAEKNAVAVPFLDSLEKVAP